MLTSRLLAQLVFAVAIPFFLYAGDVNKELRTAAKKGEIDKVRALLAQGADINSKDDYGKTALFLACEKGQAEIVSVLLKNGANMEIKDINDRLPYDIAVSKKHVDVEKLLLINHPRLGDAFGFAAIKGYTDVVGTVLANREIDPESYYAFQLIGQIAKKLAIKNSHFETAKAFKRAGVDIRATPYLTIDEFQITFTLMRKTDESILSMSFETKNNVELKYSYPPLSLNYKQYEIHLIDETGQTLKPVPKGGVHSGNSSDGALNYELSFEVPLSTRMKILKIGNIFFKLEKLELSEQLLIASALGHTESVHALLDKGADIEASDSANQYYTALLWAVNNSHLATTKALTEAGADLNAQMEAAKAWVSGPTFGGPTFRNSRSVQELFQQQITTPPDDIMAFEELMSSPPVGTTALMLAILNGNRDIAKLLIEKGANPNITNGAGETAYSLAIKKGQSEIIELLKKVSTRE